MCTSKPPDPSAELRRQEAERQARVAQGTQKIDAMFAGFDDGFYNQRQQAQMDYYLPQLEDQYHQSYKDATARLANSGNLTSSAGADLLGRINKQYELSKQSALDNATNAASGMRSQLASDRANLISMLNGGSSMESVASSAAAKQQAMHAQPAYSPLGDLFGGITAQIGNSMLANALTTPQSGAQKAAPGMAVGSNAVQYIK
jgi:hypothetical protein